MYRGLRNAFTSAHPPHQKDDPYRLFYNSIIIDKHTCAPRVGSKIGVTFSLTLWNRRVDNAPIVECHREASESPLRAAPPAARGLPTTSSFIAARSSRLPSISLNSRRYTLNIIEPSHCYHNTGSLYAAINLQTIETTVTLQWHCLLRTAYDVGSLK